MLAGAGAGQGAILQMAEYRNRLAWSWAKPWPFEAYPAKVMFLLAPSAACLPGSFGCVGSKSLKVNFPPVPARCSVRGIEAGCRRVASYLRNMGKSHGMQGS